MNAKNILCLSLAALMMVGTLVSCNSGTEDDTETTITSDANASGVAETTDGTEPDETARANTKDNLPDDLNLEGLLV